MNPIKTGEWRVRLVEVNSRPAGETEKFQTLITTADEIRLEPAGIKFSIQQSTARSAVLESRSQIFFADFSSRGDRLLLNLTRPAFSEKISLLAEYVGSAIDSGLVETT